MLARAPLAGLLAGLVRPDRGRILVDGEVLVDRAAGIFVPPHRRRIGSVFQDGRLFPHLASAATCSTAPGAPAGARPAAPFDDIVELLGIGHLLERRPATLSGGEKQRVADRPRPAASPRLLLMDEPLAALDWRPQGRVAALSRPAAGDSRLPMLYVSHAPDEILRLATPLVLIEAGAQLAEGPVEEVMSRADFAAAAGSRTLVTIVTAVIETP